MEKLKLCDFKKETVENIYNLVLVLKYLLQVVLYQKLKNFFSVKYTVKRMKTKLETGRKYWQILYSINYIHRIHKNPQNSTVRNQLKPRQKRNRYFTKEDIRMANKHKKRCATPLTIREIKIVVTGKYYYIPSAQVKIKNIDNTKC